VQYEAAGDDVSYRYHSDGRLAGITGANGEVEIEYDANGALSRFTFAKSDARTVVEYESGRPVSRTNPFGLRDQIEYDVDGQLSGVDRGDNGRWTVRNEGSLTTFSRDGVTLAEIARDTSGRVVCVVH
jgi:YD repeat-containing protein